ncbi:MAG: RHS repeat-associated core domain-containing protein, partial [Chloroflexota bacterium]
RLMAVDFDTDGDLVVEESVSYAYDIRGKRTTLTMPDNLTIDYSYDERGRLVSLTDWDTGKSSFHYDKLDRHRATQRPNGMRSVYKLDEAGRLRELRHENRKRETLAGFRYTLDKRGNRTETRELRLAPGAVASTTTISHSDNGVEYINGWTDETSFHTSTRWDARLKVLFVGDENVELEMGVGPDHSIYDVYIDGTLYKSIDGYAATAGSRVEDLSLRGDGWHVLEIRNQREKNLQSSAYKVRFKALSMDTALDRDVIRYTYDALSRLLEADYNEGSTVYTYGYDTAGNLVNKNSTTRTYNAANQMVNDGTNNLTYDDNGNLTNDGVDAYTWDRANRMLSVGTTSYAYDGAGDRIQQTVGSVVTDYLNDTQPGLTKLLAQTTGSDTQRFVHAPRGIHGSEDNAGNWHYYAQDGLGSVRGVVSDVAAVQASQSYDPYGDPLGSYGDGFGFTGEQTDANGQLYLRARYYIPEMGTFSALDPWEGVADSAMSLNGYSWVDGNVPNAIDPSGMYWWVQSNAFPFPTPDFSNIEVKNLISVYIQSQAIGRTNVHAEYPISYTFDNKNESEHIDLMIVNDSSRNVRYWEIKPNNSNQWGRANRSIRNIRYAVAYAKDRNHLSQQSCVSRQHSCSHPHGQNYNWNSYNWIPGTDYPRKQFLFQIPGSNTSWFAGQRYNNGQPVEGVIVYWREQDDDYNDYVPIALPENMQRPSQVENDYDGYNTEVPDNVIPFPSTGSEQEVAAAISSSNPWEWEICQWFNGGLCNIELSDETAILWGIVLGGAAIYSLGSGGGSSGAEYADD